MKNEEYTAYAVKTLRTRLGISQEALARKLDVALKTVCRYESGRHAATGKTAKALAWVCLELECDDYRETFVEFFNKCTANYVLSLKQQAAEEMHEAIRNLLDIGRRDLSNPKYDGYFSDLKAALDKAEAA